MPWKSLKHALLFNAVGTALLGLLMGIVSDVMYMLIDPRIDFESREV